MEIKLCSKNDLSNIGQLAVLFSELGYGEDEFTLKQRLSKIIDHEDYCMLLLRERGRIIGLSGMCKMMFYEKEGFYMRILAFVIGSEYRNNGNGKRLLEASIKFAKSLDCKTITLNSGNRAERDNAHKFYESCGFTQKSQGFTMDIF